MKKCKGIFSGSSQQESSTMLRVPGSVTKSKWTPWWWLFALLLIIILTHSEQISEKCENVPVLLTVSINCCSFRAYNKYLNDIFCVRFLFQQDQKKIFAIWFGRTCWLQGLFFITLETTMRLHKCYGAKKKNRSRQIHKVAGCSLSTF